MTEEVKDYRLNKRFSIIDTSLPPKYLAVGVLSRKLGPGRFECKVEECAWLEQDSKHWPLALMVYSCQLRPAEDWDNAPSHPPARP